MNISVSVSFGTMWHTWSWHAGFHDADDDDGVVVNNEVLTGDAGLADISETTTVLVGFQRPPHSGVRPNSLPSGGHRT